MKWRASHQRATCARRVQQPDDVVFVMDSSIGQAARDQAQAFKDAVAVGASSVCTLLC